MRSRRRTSRYELPELRKQIVGLREAGFSLHAIGDAVDLHHSTVVYHLRHVNVATPRERAQYLVNRGAGI